MEEKEKRVRAITRLYYANPKVQKAMLAFAQGREVVPRYFEGFGKRPDMLQYPSDLMGLVNKGATSFHGSEELWSDPLSLSSDITAEEMGRLRKGWDLLIDIDSPFLDCSRVAARLIITALEHHGIKNFGLKFSGSKGFHIIIAGKAFPEIYQGEETRRMFPEWPRAISEYLMSYIRRDYNLEVGKMLSEKEIMSRTTLTQEDLNAVRCRQCGSDAQKGMIVKFICPVCNLTMDRRDVKLTKRRLRCLSNDCAGVLEVLETKEYFMCASCKDPENEKMALASDKHPDSFELGRGINAEKVANLDMVLVAPRHLFRMPYSLHEKTSLASIVLTKEQLETFSPKQADPLKVQIVEYYPQNTPDEAKALLAAALEWKKNKNAEDEKKDEKSYGKYKQAYEPVEISGLTEELFPPAIKKLLKGLKDGRKRGVFILITFLRSLGFAPEYIVTSVRDWNKRNEPPLKEGYIKGQLDWHLRQKKRILPPNYDNPSFYKDLNLIEKAPTSKNPIVDAMREARRRGLIKEKGSEDPKNPPK